MFSKIFIKITKEFKNKNRQAIVESEKNDSTANADFGHNSDENSSNTDNVEQQLVTIQSAFDILIIENISLTDHHADFEFINLQQEQICDMIRNIMHMKFQFMINNIFDSIVQAIFAQTRTQISASTFSFVDSSFDFSNHMKSEFYNSSIKSLSIDQVNYFDSEYKKEKDKTTLFSSSIEFMMTTDKYVYYKNVYVFVDRLKNLMSQHKHNQIRNVLKSCFRDDAQI